MQASARINRKSTSLNLLGPSFFPSLTPSCTAGGPSCTGSEILACVFNHRPLELLKTRKRLLRTLEASLCLFEPEVLGFQVPKRGTEREEMGFGWASPSGSIHSFPCRRRQGTRRMVLRPEAPESPGSLLEMKKHGPIHRPWWSKSACSQVISYVYLVWETLL